MRLAGLLLAALGGTVVFCKPYEAFGASSQYPPVAYPEVEFSFQLSNDTFKSTVNDSAQIEYSAFEFPSWLQFDSQSRVLSGKPSSSDLDDSSQTKQISYILQGTDPSDQSSLNKTYQLALSSETQPQVSSTFNLLSLLKNSGYTNGKNALKLTPGQVFNISFDRDTFENSSSATKYYGRSELYHAPLPPWMFFDEANLKFSGTAPVVNSDIAPEFSYSFSLLASDIEDYTSAEVQFDIVVGGHQFTTSIQNTLAVNVSSTGSFDYPLPMDYVYLDNEPVSSSNISSVSLQESNDWATVTNETLSGTLPEGKSSENLTVAIFDTYGDSIYLNFLVESTHRLFAVSSLPNVNATQGEWFQTQLLPSQFTDYNNTEVSLSFANTSQSTSWLSYHDSNMTLSGEVPNNFNGLTVEVLAQQNSQSQKLTFKLAAVQGKHKSSSTSSSATSTSSSSRSSATPSATSSGASAASVTSTAAVPALSTKASSNKNHTVAIACGVAIPVFVLLVLLILFLFLWRRRKSRSAAVTDRENSPQISNPRLGNPANAPAFYGGPSPFDDENSIDDNSTARRLAALNAIKLEEQANSGSDVSTMDEKAEVGTNNSSASDLYQDALQVGSTDALLGEVNNDQYFDSNKHTSSVCLNSEPTNRKSWRFSTRTANAANIRESFQSLNTVSTAELFNTQIASNQTLPKDPRKSSLGLRDSVFLGPSAGTGADKIDAMHSNSPQKSSNPLRNQVSSDRVLPDLTESPHDQNSANSQMTSSSSDDIIPVKQGDNYKWVERDGQEMADLNRKRSTKRLVNLPNKSGVNVRDANEIEGHVPEMDVSLDSIV
ncbi:LAME_0D06612g1_1 [Lachancea meyersii CBS 8951]|uniref:LAME_0D06612g1_1 n=1 Tax=Lachancea meyersii CBS 8951 TaxID=1266667 RepID=A0A1G4J989_9SACH|nr:LAME_0D06612g1_1 [Lachancea meyersii CBS 8951]